MTSEQARNLENEMQHVVKRLRAGHLEAEDVLMVAQTLEEVLAHLASAMESLTKNPRLY